MSHASGAFDVPAAADVMVQAGAENFPVALGILAPVHRRRLRAIYGFARLADELGDEAQGERLAALDWLERELESAYEGTARHPLLRTLGLVLAECPLPREPFKRLIEANRVDQRVARYDTYEQLLSYCALSANPVGELVLHAFELASPERIALSDKVCSALQLAEHWQDVVEDLGRGRVYVPAEDLERFGVDVARLPSGSDALGADDALRPDDALRTAMRRLMAFEVQRAQGLLAEGAPLLGTVSGRPKLALAGFVAGGQAALAAIARADYDVLSGPPKAGRVRRLIALARALAEHGR